MRLPSEAVSDIAERDYKIKVKRKKDGFSEQSSLRSGTGVFRQVLLGPFELTAIRNLAVLMR